MRVLCLDIEGGYGGSSRSLFESVAALHGEVEIEVWCRREGPIQARYDAIAVPCRVTPAMPHASSLRVPSRNLLRFGGFAMAWPRSAGFRASLAEAARHRFDVVHFNHEGLFLLMAWLRRRLGVGAALTMHIRTHLPASAFSRWQYRTIGQAADRLVYITENEARRCAELAGRRLPGAVIHNIVRPPEDTVAPHPALAGDPRFKVAVLSNYSYMRGIDRLVEVADVLARQGRRDIGFVVAGDMALTGSLPGELGRIARRGGSLADYVAQRGIADMFRFLGHVADPQAILTACDVLAKPTREENPWGRDILEAMAAGKPAMTVGNYDRFVENGVTGVLHDTFDAGVWADALVRLADDRAECARLGVAAKTRVLALCDARERAADLRAVWASALEQ